MLLSPTVSSWVFASLAVCSANSPAAVCLKVHAVMANQAHVSGRRTDAINALLEQTGRPFVQKPFAVGKFLAVVRQVLR